MITTYDNKPKRLFARLIEDHSGNLQRGSYCAGFECQEWRCDAFADHMMEWIADYALKEDELRVSHTNMYIRLREAAARIYRSENYKARGEIGEITLHAICRDFFDTIPFAPRVFYLTASNDVVKSFDMVHVRYVDDGSLELWLGEAKFYKDAADAINSAVTSVEAHIKQGFLNNEKLLLGPQISKEIPRYQEIRDLFSAQTSLDDLFQAAVFPILIASNSKAVTCHGETSDAYITEVVQELVALEEKVIASGLAQKIKILLIYVPLASKEALAASFDERLKGILP